MTERSDDVPASPETDPDWDNRRLCIDDSCIGVIGSDGRCRVCGLPDTNTPLQSPDVSASYSEVSDEPQGAPPAEQISEIPDPAWEDRRLCPDESCIGTLGMNGRCRVCGRTG